MTNHAKYPQSGYKRPQQISEDGFKVEVYGEDGEIFGSFNFERTKAPRQLLNDLVWAFASATSSEGRWRSKSTVIEAASLLKRFAEDIADDNQDLKSMSEFTPEMWWRWRTKILERARWPGQVNLAKSLLYDVKSLPDTTRRAVAARTKKPKKRMYVAYSLSEYRRIYATAWNVVRQARSRIHNNKMALVEWREGREPEDAPRLPIRKKMWSKGEILDYMIKTGRFPGGTVPHHRIDEFRRLLDVTETGSLTQAIFATTLEVFSLIILFACERGYNLSIISNFSTDAFTSDIQGNVEKAVSKSIDKPRRGPSARYDSASLTGKSARIWRFALDITQPARDYLSFNGVNEKSLFLGRALEGGRGSLIKSDWSECRSIEKVWRQRYNVLSDKNETLVVDFRRIRLTDQVVRQQSNQNSEQVSEEIYRKPDPLTHEMARSVILRGQEDAVNDAEATVAIRCLTPEDLKNKIEDVDTYAQKLGISKARVRQLLKGRLDTATVACVDMTNSPFDEKGTPCSASFFQCFSCKNAVATPAHLPRLVTLLDALNDIRTCVSDSVWDLDYAKVRSKLVKLLNDFSTPAEQSAARASVKAEEVETVKLLLDRRLDA